VTSAFRSCVVACLTATLCLRCTPPTRTDTTPGRPNPPLSSTGAPSQNTTPPAGVRLLAAAARARSLEPLRPVTSSRLDAERFEARLREQFELSVPTALAESQQRLLSALGIVPADFDLRSELLRFAAANVVGLYSPERQDLCVHDRLTPGQFDGVLLHEAVHALQDQHFGIGAELVPQPGNGDRLATLQAMAEGDALLAVSLAQRPGIVQPTPLVDEVNTPPAFLVRAAAAPYHDGFEFIARLYAEGGWEAVNRAWAHPPSSTEQLLHVEKYQAREPFRELPPPALDGIACTTTYWDVLGEQGARLLFEEWATPNRAAVAARGWNGDRVDVLDCEGSAVVVWRLAFDTTADRERALGVVQGRFATCDDTLPVAVAHHATSVIVAATPRGCDEARAWVRRQTP